MQPRKTASALNRICLAQESFWLVIAVPWLEPGKAEPTVLQSSGENALTCENVRKITYSGTYLA
jgi:hypothetical protein